MRSAFPSPPSTFLQLQLPLQSQSQSQLQYNCCSLPLIGSVYPSIAKPTDRPGHLLARRPNQTIFWYKVST
ncbi:hypothetical protein CROQUDRAFT_654075 [Cronartium quercuum f. sp. fusiforme G11]|uniref:Uncharacterized protein n=1 Tax=Cronartium quercuum f. sp. fusiforme G11 TaxID=708437 RepID=A0A9P6NRN7_9BASI|nr:hypothetical protein CROQUDRAFT_654075 [Cronartium quercuum f. sp. fusiforme G11]